MAVGPRRAPLAAIVAVAAATVLVALLGLQRAAAAADPCNSWAAERNAFIAAGNGAAGGLGGQSLNSIYRGLSPNGSLFAGFVPHAVLFAIAAAEDDVLDPTTGLLNYWRQNDQNTLGACPSPPIGHVHQDGLGVGAMAITSGRTTNDDYLIWNVSHGANLLIDKWNSRFGYSYGNANYPQINSNEPNEIEDWYFAIWGYNGYTCSSAYAQDNNPRDHAQANYMNWAPGLSRSAYTYQDVVYYYLQNPPGRDTWSTGTAGDQLPNGSYYLNVNVGYTLPNGGGFPPWTSFPSQACPFAAQLTTANVDYGYRWGFTSQNPPGATTELAGNAYAVSLSVQNNGNNIWYASGSGSPTLGTFNPADRVSAFQCLLASNDWMSTNRVQHPLDPVIYPASSGFASATTFSFHSCPGGSGRGIAPGTYNEYFNLVLDGATWFPDLGEFLLEVRDKRPSG